LVSIKRNLEIWDNADHWERGVLGDGVGLEDGEKWSKSWGSSRAQWQVTIEPRIADLVQEERILELAPGRGRWTKYLADLCRSLVIVDISPGCIAYCREKFRDLDHLTCLVNDGNTLKDVESDSVSFIFSFDSLVHVEREDMASYLPEFSRVLAPGGSAFIHHSNLGAYADGISSNNHMRAASVSVADIAQLAVDCGLTVLRQELLPWSEDNRDEGVFIDAFTALRKENRSRVVGEPLENRNFLDEQRLGREITESAANAPDQGGLPAHVSHQLT
jgi:SAM-dependent methyltransferase